MSYRVLPGDYSFLARAGEGNPRGEAAVAVVFRRGRPSQIHFRGSGILPDSVAVESFGGAEWGMFGAPSGPAVVVVPSPLGRGAAGEAAVAVVFRRGRLNAGRAASGVKPARALSYRVAQACPP